MSLEVLLWEHCLITLQTFLFLLPPTRHIFTSPCYCQNSNLVLCILWIATPKCYFRQSWLASSWALTVLPPTSSPSCSSSSTPATGPSTWSSCQTSSSTGYLSEPPAQIRPVYHLITIYASLWTRFTKRSIASWCIGDGGEVVVFLTVKRADYVLLRRKSLLSILRRGRLPGTPIP